MFDKHTVQMRKLVERSHEDDKITEILKSLHADVEQKIMCNPKLDQRRSRMSKDGAEGLRGRQNLSW